MTETLVETMTHTLADVGETELVAYLKAAFAPAMALPLGIGDDAAVVDGSNPLVMASDAMVEGVHFDRRYWEPVDVGRKLVAVNVSDFAAMGASPRHALLTFSAPSSTGFAWACEVIDGIAGECARYDLVIVGGDVTSSPGPVFLSLALTGEPGQRVLRRDTARPGQGLFVTGWPGLAACGFAAASSGQAGPADALDRFFRPEVRLEWGQALTGSDGACMDLSDGLAIDAPRLAASSAVELVIELGQIPRHPALGTDGLGFAVNGGEDYELLFTCAGAPPIPATRIGTVRRGEPGVIWCQDGVPVSRPPGPGFEHF